jgi:hypothetical protein
VLPVIFLVIEDVTVNKKVQPIIAAKMFDEAFTKHTSRQGWDCQKPSIVRTFQETMPS